MRVLPKILADVLKRMLLLVAVLTGIAPVAARAEVAQPVRGVIRGNAATYAEGRGPAIWLIERGNTKIYLFGTVHVFPAALRWRTAALDRVIAEADELVLETPDAARGPGAVQADPERMMRPMRLGKAVPILSRVSPEARGPLAAVIESSGLPMEVYDNLTTWGAGFLLTGFQIRQGLSPDGVAVPTTGAEEVLSQIFLKRRRPISGVETMMDQLNVFATMPLSAQRRFLESTVMGPPPGSEAAAAAERPAEQPGTEIAWISGDVEGIAADMAQMPREIYDPLLTRRNANWVRWLEARLDRPGTVLFAVGAGHLAGPESVQAMLATRGITARRIN